jgi:hypothetical protein
VRAILILFIQIVDKPEVQHREQRQQAVARANLFAFGVGSREVAYWCLEYSSPALRQFEYKFDFETKVIASERYRFEKRCVYRLVTGFDVGEGKISEPIAQNRHALVDHCVPIHQRSAVRRRQVPRTEDRVRALFCEREKQGWNVCGIVFEIGIVDNGNVAGQARKSSSYRGAFSLIGLVGDQRNARVFVGELFQHFKRAVGACIIDDYQF